VVWVNFDILEAWYGQTDKDEEFLRRQNERSILNLGIPFATLVPNQPTTWLTAVKHEFLSFFQRNKDPRAYVGKF
jgi:hypothetical protein